MYQNYSGRVLLTAEFAVIAHDGQVRKGNKNIPYIVHPLRVASRAMEFGLYEDLVIACILHDVVEDTSVTLEDLRATKLQFSNDTLKMVDLCTKWWDDHAPKEVKDEQNPIYYGRILKDQGAIIIKLLDRADNLEGMSKNPTLRKWTRSYLRKTHAEFVQLAEACEYPKVVDYFWGAVKEAEGRVEMWDEAAKSLKDEQRHD